MQQLHNFKYMSSAAPLMIFLLTFRNCFPWAEPTVLCMGHLSIYRGHQIGVSFHLILVYPLKLATLQFLAGVGWAHYKNTITSLLVIDHVFLTMKTMLPFHLYGYNSSTNLTFRHISEEVLTVSFK